MEWSAPDKPAELAESRLIIAILENRFPIGSSLPAERELASMLGVTRPTLREVLQRLARDGWIEIRHGRSTRVRNYWSEGNLGVLGAIARYPSFAPDDFVPNLLTVRQLMAPAYTRQAVECSPDQVIELLEGIELIGDDPVAFAQSDWDLHHQLTIWSGNAIFTLIVNGFRELYATMAQVYFAIPEARDHSRAYYRDLLAAAQSSDLETVERLTGDVMKDSLRLWQRAAEHEAG
jgi:GntR family negative regulator for fad regulon and positive regulator of fabA